MIIFLSPHRSSFADYDTFTVNIPNSQGGYTALEIKNSGDGYVGPRGEFYSQFPMVSQLQSVYGVPSDGVERERMIEKQSDEQNKAAIQKELEQRKILERQAQEALEEAQQKIIQQRQLMDQQIQQNVQQRVEQATPQLAEVKVQEEQHQLTEPKEDFFSKVKRELLYGLLGIVILSCYFLPSIVAFSRKHLNFMPIFLVNLFLGFTGIGWIVALVWSVSHQKKIS